MPLYYYETVGRRGKKAGGIIPADSFEEAKESLRKKELLVTTITLFKEKRYCQSLPEVVLLDFTRSLAQLLKAGLPLYESLITIEEKYLRTKYHAIFLGLCDRVKHGKQLSTALKEYPRHFDSLFVSMVAAGEETGDLAGVFHDLTHLLSRLNNVKKQLRSSMIYPIFLLSFCLIVVVALFYFLIPSMMQLFEDRSLHAMTRFVIGISRWLTSHTLLVCLFIGMTVVGLIAFFQHPKGKRLFCQFCLTIPYVKPTISAAVLSRFCRALGILLSSSVPIVLALRFARKIMRNPFFERVVEEAEEQIIQGKKLSDELSRSPLFPPMIIRLLSIGEETGNQSEMLGKISDIYEEELEKRLKTLTSMIQPVMLLILAFIVGLVVVSVLLPLTDVSSFLS